MNGIVLTIIAGVAVEIIAHCLIRLWDIRRAKQEAEFNRKVDGRISEYMKSHRYQNGNRGHSKAKK